MEEIGLTILLILASIYVLWHVKKTLTFGEGDKGCHNCPLVSHDLKKQEKENLT